MKRFSTFLTVSVFVASALGFGCATTTAAPPGATAFSGEVWTWDEQENTITLRQGMRDIRVNVSPDQFVGLQLHSNRTIYGTLAPPKALPTVLIDAPSTVVARGPADETEVTGTIISVDPAGKLVVNTSQGQLQVWRADGGLPFTTGGNVRIRMRTQPLDVVLVQPGQTVVSTTTPAPTPAASPRTEPGDYAAVMGPITAVDPAGSITVQSARGPIVVRVPNASRYKVGDTVEVRTSVHPA